MSDVRIIVDPSAQFIDQQYDILVDFIFRLTADRSRAAVMGREACRQAKDELSSQPDHAEMKRQVFQLAYELNEEAMRPISRDFFESWYRYQHQDPRSVAIPFRWELRLLELGHHATQLLLLRYRYDFSLEDCAIIMNRDASELMSELETLEKLLAKDKSLQLGFLANLPQYGFLDIPELQQTALSHLMQSLRPQAHLLGRLAAVLALLMLASFGSLIYYLNNFREFLQLIRKWLGG